MNREILPKVKIIMNKANTISKSYSDNYVRPEHIMLAILNEDNNTCVNHLKNMGVDLTELYDDICKELQNSELSNGSLGYKKK